MLNEEIKKLISEIGGIVIVEGNEPRFIFLSYEKFLELTGRKSKTQTPDKQIINRFIDKKEDLDNNKEGETISEDKEEEILDELNKEILALKEEIKEKEELLMNSE